MSPPKRLVAIDGPAGAGKSTAARTVAHRLQIPYFNTGAMYRALALYALENRIPFEEPELLTALGQCAIRLDWDGSQMKVFVDNREVTQELRRPEVGEAASRLSVFPAVRAEMVRRQRLLGESRGGVLEGRDIGSVVFPDAAHKFYITASVEERARRRTRELLAMGKKANFEAVRREIEERDRRDTEREDSPLVIPPGALVIDTTGRDAGEVVEYLLSYLDIQK